MKKYILLATVLASNFAYATGSVSCTSESTELNLSFATSHIQGNPIYSDITVNSEIISKDRVINYKNIDGELYVLVLDEDFNEKALEVKYNFNSEVGSVLIAGNGIETKISDIKCELE